jgi:hypothetical protein
MFFLCSENKTNGLRWALIAYWHEALIGLKERGSGSIFSKYNNWNAITKIKKRMSE